MALYVSSMWLGGDAMRLSLRPREITILELFISGLDKKQIANKLGTNSKNIYSHFGMAKKRNNLLSDHALVIKFKELKNENNN